jgi:hypothetical protein
LQQSSATPPSGFTNFLRITTTTADASPAAGSAYFVSSNIEGLNLQDLQLGAATAKTITISFWIRSSLTGSFSGSISNSADNRSYPFSYTISAANTWEQKTVTIAGDTTGTWLTDTGIGMRFRLDLGSGSTFRGTAGAWAAASIVGVTSAVRVISTLSATFDITGVQLEIGSAATPFEVRDYATELVRCQRYYELVGAMSTGIQASTTTVGSSGTWDLGSRFLVRKRSTPVISLAPASVLPSSISMSYLPGNGQTASTLSAWTTFANTLTSWRGRITGTVGVGANVNGTAIYAVDTDGFLQADARL